MDPDERRIADTLAEPGPYVEVHGVEPATEPLHPMCASDRRVAGRFPAHQVGVTWDTYRIVVGRGICSPAADVYMTYTRRMSDVMIRVPAEVRDQLAAVAEARGTSLRALMQDIAAQTL